MSLLSEILQSAREYLYYRKNEPWRYMPDKDPAVPFNWTAEETAAGKQLYWDHSKKCQYGYAPCGEAECQKMENPE